MKRRGWRVALTVATVGLALVAGLVALNWATVRDHAEAWLFQVTRETAERTPLDPDPLHGSTWMFQCLADDEGQPVVFDTGAAPWARTRSLRLEPRGVAKGLRSAGYRILEQRFPRRAYIVVGYPTERASPPHQRPPKVRGAGDA
jgi:hypothetical protein